MKSKNVLPTMFNYSIVNRATGATEIIKNVLFTFYHDNLVELHTSDNGEYKSFTLADYAIVKRA